MTITALIRISGMIGGQTKNSNKMKLMICKKFMNRFFGQTAKQMQLGFGCVLHLPIGRGILILKSQYSILFL